MKEKSIKEVVDEFRSAFGAVEFKATNCETGQVGGSKHWVESLPPRLEINGADYLSLGELSKQMPTDGVVAGLLKIELGKK